MSSDLSMGSKERWKKYGWMICECGKYMVKDEEKSKPNMKACTGIWHHGATVPCTIQHWMAKGNTEDEQRAWIRNQMNLMGRTAPEAEKLPAEEITGLAGSSDRDLLRQILEICNEEKGSVRMKIAGMITEHLEGR